MKKIKIKFDKFILILISIFLVFFPLIFVTLPTLYSFKNINKKVEKIFFSNFKLFIDINSNILYKPFPKPHFEIKEANLYLGKNDQLPIIENGAIKLFLPLDKIHEKNNFTFDSVEVQNLNINLNYEKIKKIRQHLYSSVNKPIILKKVKLFYRNGDNEVIMISPINKASIIINNKKKTKYFEISGKLFDINFNSIWIRDYNLFKNTKNEIKIKNPDISINNKFIKGDNNNFSGSSDISFLDNNLIFNYNYKDKKIDIVSPDSNKRQNFKIFSKVNLDPFHIQADLTILNKKIDFFTDYLFRYLIVNSNDQYLGNFNGFLNINLENINNTVIKEGKVRLKFLNKKIELIDASFNLKKMGNLNSRLNYYEDEDSGKISVLLQNSLIITNYLEFAREFQLSSRKIKEIEKINFDVEKLINENEFFISNIEIEETKTKRRINKKFKIKNIQVLRSILGEII